MLTTTKNSSRWSYKQTYLQQDRQSIHIHTLLFSSTKFEKHKETLLAPYDHYLSMTPPYETYCIHNIYYKTTNIPTIHYTAPRIAISGPLDTNIQHLHDETIILSPNTYTYNYTHHKSNINHNTPHINSTCLQTLVYHTQINKIDSTITNTLHTSKYTNT